MTASGNDHSYNSVFRHGSVLNTGANLSREDARAFAKKLAAGWDDLRNLVDGLDDVENTNLLNPSRKPEIFDADKIVIKFPDLHVKTGSGIALILGLNCTVCQTDTHSKTWIRMSFNSDFPEYRSLSEEIAELFQNFYFENCLTHAVVSELPDERVLHTFHIFGSDVTDPGLIDAINEVSRTGALDKSAKQGKADSLRGALKSAMETVSSANLPKDFDVSELWKAWYSRYDGFVNIPAIDTHRSIYFIGVDEENSVTFVNGKSIDTSAGRNRHSTEVAQPSAHFTSARLAGQLAAGL